MTTRKARTWRCATWTLARCLTTALWMQSWSSSAWTDISLAGSIMRGGIRVLARVPHHARANDDVNVQFRNVLGVAGDDQVRALLRQVLLHIPKLHNGR